MKKGTDYTLSYRNNTALNDGSNPGKLPVVIIRGKGCFTGACEVAYKITARDIGGLTMSASDKVWQNKKNTYRTKVVIRDVDGKALSAGREIRPDGEIQVKLNGQVLSGDNYEITGYTNNINKGTATVTIKGRNDCGGVKTVKFRIKRKGFL